MHALSPAGTLDNVCWRISAPAGRYAVVNIHSISVERNFDYLTARRSRGPTTVRARGQKGGGVGMTFMAVMNSRTLMCKMPV